MLQNVTIEARNAELDDIVRAKMEQEIDRIQRHAGQDVINVRAEVIGTPHHRQGTYEIRLIVSVPGDVLKVSHVGNLDTQLVVEAFAALDRQLREHNRMRQQDVKRHEAHVQHGQVLRVNREEGFGFLRPDKPESVDVYFHQNAVKDTPFEKLEPGQRVAYHEEPGDEGPQAIWVRLA